VIEQGVPGADPMYRSIAMTAIAALALVTMPALTKTFAQSWQEYRRDDCGVKIEMPGSPQITEQEIADAGNKETVRWTRAELDRKEASLSISCRQFGRDIRHRPIDMYVDNIRKLTEAALGVKVTGQNQLVVNNKPVRELLIETDGFYLITRMVFLEDRIIEMTVTSIRPLADNPVANRFLRSFELLP
jgi:hypothetical protein